MDREAETDIAFSFAPGILIERAEHGERHGLTPVSMVGFGTGANSGE